MKYILIFLFFFNKLKTFQICKNNFFNFLTEINNKEILIIEKYNFHGECIPGFIKYFLDLGYKNIDILLNVNLNKLRPLNISFFENKINILAYPPKLIEKYIILGMCNFYKVCIFNTIEFQKKDKIRLYLYKKQKFKKIIVFHELNNIKKNDIYNFNIIVLKKFNNNFPVYEVNPHFYGFYLYHNKSKITKFIIVGSVQSLRKNFLLLFKNIEKLINNNILNFNVTIIGYSIEKKLKKLLYIKKLSGFVNFIEKLSYDKMYDYVSKGDFFLPLLDPKTHYRYLKEKTSGSFQLVYGLNIPMIIEKKFAEKYKFNNSNSVIYETNEEFFDKLNYSINMKNEEYIKLKYNLKIKTDEIEKKSIENLKFILSK